MPESEPQTPADYLVGIFNEDIASEICNLIFERAMPGVTLGIVTAEEAHAHLEQVQSELFMETLLDKDDEE